VHGRPECVVKHQVEAHIPPAALPPSLPPSSPSSFLPRVGEVQGGQVPVEGRAGGEKEAGGNLGREGGREGGRGQTEAEKAGRGSEGR
jgi:hypothetical protein